MSTKPSFGRRQAQAARREQLLDEFDRSGLSAAEFARQHGLQQSRYVQVDETSARLTRWITARIFLNRKITKIAKKVKGMYWLTRLRFATPQQGR